MDNKNMRGLWGLVVVVLLSFGVILGTKKLVGTMQKAPQDETAQTADREFDTSRADGVDKAVRLKAGGYETVVRIKGYGGEITMAVNFARDRETIESVNILEQTETEGVGGRITEEDFLRQFAGMEAPVQLPGAFGSAGNTGKEGIQGDDLDDWQDEKLRDGTYEAQGLPDENGFVDRVSVTVKDGKITGASWDAATEDGQSKSVMSENGEYTMTEEGLTWKEQAEALAAALVENQSLKNFSVDEEGKTDTVAGVSISAGGFINLAQQCLQQAAGESDEGVIDAISGATVSSAAVGAGINLAYEFLQEAED